MTQYNALPRPLMPQICWPTSPGVDMMDETPTFFQAMKVKEGRVSSEHPQLSDSVGVYELVLL